MVGVEVDPVEASGGPDRSDLSLSTGLNGCSILVDPSGLDGKISDRMSSLLAALGQVSRGVARGGSRFGSALI